MPQMEKPTVSVPGSVETPTPRTPKQPDAPGLVEGFERAIIGLEF